jgi:BlaI family transcriptional regulator, penicillinase repressor
VPKKKTSSASLTPLELDVMKVLWNCGPATVQAVFQQMQSTRPLAYNTVQTMLTILHRKGKVKRVIKERAYVYTPAITREKTAAHALREMVDKLFGGRPEALVLSMVKNRQLTPEQLAKLQEMVERGGDDGDT